MPALRGNDWPQGSRDLVKRAGKAKMAQLVDGVGDKFWQKLNKSS
jgi:hypothetical protein